jgi:hypothetical protein
VSLLSVSSNVRSKNHRVTCKRMKNCRVHRKGDQAWSRDHQCKSIPEQQPRPDPERKPKPMVWNEIPNPEPKINTGCPIYFQTFNDCIY